MKRFYKLNKIICILFIIILINPIVYANINDEQDDEKILYEYIIKELEDEKNTLETSNNKSNYKSPIHNPSSHNSMKNISWVIVMELFLNIWIKNFY